MSKLLQIFLFIFSMGIGKTTFAQTSNTPTDKSLSKIAKKQVIIPVKKMDLDQHQKAQNSYLNSSIHSITAKKDSLLQVYGTFDAARKAGALVRKPMTNDNPKKK